MPEMFESPGRPGNGCADVTGCIIGVPLGIFISVGIFWTGFKTIEWLNEGGLTRWAYFLVAVTVFIAIVMGLAVLHDTKQDRRR